MKQSRQQRALQRLEAQLASGVKTKKGTRYVKIPLTDNDVKRITREISNIKSKK